MCVWLSVCVSWGHMRYCMLKTQLVLMTHTHLYINIPTNDHILCSFFSYTTEKLYNSNGRDLRRALFSLKQIFQVTSHCGCHLHMAVC